MSADMNTPSTHTPGPWAWFGNPAHGQIYLATVNRGRIFVMDFVRMGFQGAQPRFQKNGIMEKAEDLATFQVCNAEGYANAKTDGACYRYDMDGINHPDARLIALSPDHALFLSGVTSGNVKWDPWAGNQGEIVCGCLRYATTLDEFGCPVLTNTTREAIEKAKGGTT